MCGIYGLVSLSRRPIDPPPLEHVRAALRHRGPDGSGCRQLPHALVGAERLRIIDPRSHADQPFASPDNRLWLVCNGEIYNAPDLRRRFAGYPYRSASDVEPILPLVMDGGPDAVALLDGMFALALWDEARARLLLARDRAGEKPLFHARMGDTIAFASEIEALLHLTGLRRDPDWDAARDFLALGYVREPRTVFAGVCQIDPGTISTFDTQGEHVVRYWEPERIDVIPIAAGDAADRLEASLGKAVGRQLCADRPRGVFSSGGVDSGLLASLATERAGRDALESFCVGFEDPSYDESPHAERLARWLGIRHTTVRVGDQALGEAFTSLTRDVSEPLGDPAALPTWLLAREASQHVKVVLSGEGADELFGGYPTYLGHRLAPFWSALPTPLRRGLRWLVDCLPLTVEKVPVEYLLKRFVAGAEHEDWLERHLMWFGTGASVHRLPFTVYRAPAEQAAIPHASVNGERSTVNAVRSAMLFDYLTYLRSGLLPKIDRTTMRHGLESRAPYLDREVTALALSLPTELRVRGITTKWLLKRVAERHVPRRFVHRRKRGLSVPIARWINGGLRAEVDRLLAPDRLQRWGALHVSGIRRMLVEHRAGRANHARALWPLIVLERWAERWLS